jgi:PAS fold.
MMEKAKSGTNLELEHRLLMPDGQVKHLHVIARPLTNESGELEYVGTLMDVTERRRHSKKLKRFATNFRERTSCCARSSVRLDV